jgi:hypothetical protein
MLNGKEAIITLAFRTATCRRALSLQKRLVFWRGLEHALAAQIRRFFTSFLTPFTGLANYCFSNDFSIYANGLENCVFKAVL